MKNFHKDSQWVKIVPYWFWGQKVKGHNALISENGLCRVIAIPLHLLLWNFTHKLIWVNDLPYWFWGQKVKVTMHELPKMFMPHNCYPFTPIIMKLHTQPLPMSRGCALLILGSKGQRTRSQCIDYWKRCISHNCYPFTLIIMKLHTQTHMSWWFVILILGSKGQRSRKQCMNYRKYLCRIIAIPLHLSSRNFTHSHFLWVEDVPYWFWGQKVKGQGHNALITEKGVCRKIAIPLQLSSWNFTHRPPWVEDLPYWFWGAKVKVTMH